MSTGLTPSASRLLLAGAVLWACMNGVALAAPPQALTLGAAFTPDELAAPTNLSMTLGFTPSTGVVPPIREVRAYGPAGLTVNVRGMATCGRIALERVGPEGCPPQSRLGFGGGVGAVELAGETVREPFTLDFFLAPRQRGRLQALIYVNASSPVPVQFVLGAEEVDGPPPYGFGLAVEVPAVDTVPGASSATVETSYASLGAANSAYYRTVDGRRKLVPVDGLLTPASCPGGGFPVQVTVAFEGEQPSTATDAIPCPRGRR
jgi:hypothetical protein